MVALSPELGVAVLYGVVREANPRPQRQEAICKDRRGEQKRGFTQDLWGAGRRLGGRFGKVGMCNLILAIQGGLPLREAAGGAPV